MADTESGTILSEDDVVSVYEYTCTLCEEDDINTGADFYCRKCCKQYCKTCVEVHKKAHRQHTVLGRRQLDEWGTVKREGTVEICPDHEGKEVEMYCVDHDQLCCSVCMSVMHRLVTKQIFGLLEAVNAIV